MIHIAHWFVFLIGVMGIHDCVFAQGIPADTERALQELRQEQKSIREELQAIRSLLSHNNNLTGSKVSNSLFSLENVDIRGSKTARLVLVEFTDYQCAYCAKFNKTAFPEIIRQYVDNGRIRYGILNKPLRSHPLASQAAEASLCAKEQGKFWEMHNQMMINQESLGKILSLAQSLRLNLPMFEECLKAHKYADVVNNDIALANKLGISGVPSFLLALSDAENPLRLRAITEIRGAQSFVSFQTKIDGLLASMPK